MREAFCPEASTVEERTACYQMITEALRSDRLADNQSNRSAQKKPKVQEEEKSNSESEISSGQEAELLAGEEEQEIREEIKNKNSLTQCIEDVMDYNIKTFQSILGKLKGV